MSKNFAPAAERNKGPLADALAPRLPAAGTVLEIASGTGQHAVFFAGRFPHLRWQPSDADPEQLPSIEAWAREAELDNVAAPLALDATAESWPVSRADAIFNANMVHIAPWEACLGLLAGAGRTLPAGAALFTYGPYRIDGHTADSNLRFEEQLRSWDPRYGVREVRDIEAAAAPHGLVLEDIVAMPANNHVLVWRRAP